MPRRDQQVGRAHLLELSHCSVQGKFRKMTDWQVGARVSRYGWDGTNHPVGIPDRIVIYFPNRIVSWNNPQHLVKFQDRMVNPVHSNDYETDVYVNHNRDITSETAKV